MDVTSEKTTNMEKEGKIKCTATDDQKYIISCTAASSIGVKIGQTNFHLSNVTIRIAIKLTPSLLINMLAITLLRWRVQLKRSI